jgi:hypothetical protein
MIHINLSKQGAEALMRLSRAKRAFFFVPLLVVDLGFYYLLRSPFVLIGALVCVYCLVLPAERDDAEIPEIPPGDPLTITFFEFAGTWEEVRARLALLPQAAPAGFGPPQFAELERRVMLQEIGSLAGFDHVVRLGSKLLSLRVDVRKVSSIDYRVKVISDRTIVNLFRELLQKNQLAPAA